MLYVLQSAKSRADRRAKKPPSKQRTALSVLRAARLLYSILSCHDGCLAINQQHLTIVFIAYLCPCLPSPVQFTMHRALRTLNQPFRRAVGSLRQTSLPTPMTRLPLTNAMRFQATAAGGAPSRGSIVSEMLFYSPVHVGFDVCVN
jgi:hypothetical protein